MPLRVSALTKRPRDVDAEVGGQRLADAQAKGQRSDDQRGPESKSGGSKPARSGPELKDK